MKRCTTKGKKCFSFQISQIYHFIKVKLFINMVLKVDSNHIEIAQVDYDIGDFPGNIIFFLCCIDGLLFHC